LAKKKGPVVDFNRIETEVFAFSEPAVASLQAELIDVEYVKEAGSWYLRLYIDREPPVDHDLCEQVSNLVSDLLDQHDPIAESYYLEVSSPGLERPLRRPQDFARFAGSEAVVKLYAPLDGKKEYCGVLQGLEEDGILLAVADSVMTFPLEKVAKAHLKAEF